MWGCRPPFLELPSQAQAEGASEESENPERRALIQTAETDLALPSLFWPLGGSPTQCPLSSDLVCPVSFPVTHFFPPLIRSPAPLAFFGYQALLRCSVAMVTICLSLSLWLPLPEPKMAWVELEDTHGSLSFRADSG